MEEQVISKLNKIKKTSVYEFVTNNIESSFGIGKIKVCTILLKDIIYQFIICETNKIKNKLFFRYFDKVWSNFYQEMDYIDDSKYYFNLTYNTLIENKHYNLLIQRGIKSISFTKYNNLFVNGIITRKDKI